MSKTLKEVAKQLEKSEKKVQLIYAFNGTGKTRLSREFKDKVAPKDSESEEHDGGQPRDRILYYNAFTEDLFYWDNDLDNDENPTLKVHPNTFTNWLMAFLTEQGQDSNIVKYFQKCTHSKITPYFDQDMTEVYFSFTEKEQKIKISKGEESNFIWSIMYTFFSEAINVLNDKEEDRTTNIFDNLEYIYIDDPVSSLDENHLIEVAIDIVRLIRLAEKINIKFVISTHNALFYNVFLNSFTRQETKGKKMLLQKYTLRKMDDGLVQINENDDAQLSYHLHLKKEIENALANGHLKKYHFNFLRNILEKTAVFLGYSHWKDLQFSDEIKQTYEERIINISSHSDYVSDEVADLNDKSVDDFRTILNAINKNYKFKQIEVTHEH